MRHAKTTFPVQTSRDVVDVDDTYVPPRLGAEGVIDRPSGRRPPATGGADPGCEGSLSKCPDGMGVLLFGRTGSGT